MVCWLADNGITVDGNRALREAWQSRRGTLNLS